MIDACNSRDRRAGPRRGLLGSAAVLAATAGALAVAQPANAAALAEYSVTLTPGPLSIQVDFQTTDPASGGGDNVGSFVATAKATGQPDKTCTATTADGGATTATCYLTGLVAGATYTVTSVARNLTNTSNLNGVTATPATQTAVPTKLNAPASVTAVPNGKTGEVDVSWVPGTNANANVTNFTATAYLGTNSTGKSCTSESGSVYACTVTGLTDGTPYSFKVVANGPAASANSNATASSGTVTPGVKPAAPTNVVASTNAAGAVTVSWTPSTTAGATYSVTAYEDGVTPAGTVLDCTTPLTAASNSVTCSGSGAVAGKEYVFKVDATKDGLTSDVATSNSIFKVSAAPSPTGVTATGGDTELTASWTAPTTGTITNYRVNAVGGGDQFACTTTGLTCKITGLTNGTAYTVTVEAISSTGTASAAVAATGSPVTPAIVPKPDAPTITTPAQSDITANAATISWTPAAAVSGAAVQYYIATATPKASGSAAGATPDAGNPSCTAVAPATTCTINGLLPGTQYNVSVVAYASATAYSTAGTLSITTSGSPAPSGGGMSGPVVTNREGKSQMFARGGDGNLYTNVRDASGNWGQWTSLGGLIGSEPVAVVNGSGTSARLQVFVLGAADHAVWFRLQNANDTGFGPWTHVSGSRWISKIEVQKNQSGTVQVFGRGADGNLYYSVQTTATDPGTWQDWVSLGGLIASDPTVVQWADGTLEVFAIGAGDGQIWHRWQTKPGDNTSWAWWAHVAPSTAQNIGL
ncbi:fibronectin type III domain-containing protein [Dactylosporangium sp. CA-139066]|uniref:fibronectin type III domain-containing protein n=1 Tax=Dactylosporangium sp. CA-139066 TaxID=3239930 RepID=UPI003D89D204